MTAMINIEVLIAGAGPIGLTAAIELARHGIALRIIDPLHEPPQYAKAVGVQPRTLEVLEGMGVLRSIMDAAIQMRGQIVYVNGEKVTQMDLATPRPPTASPTDSTAGANPSWPTFRQCSTGSPPSPLRLGICGGPRCSGSATASWTATVGDAFSWQVTPRTSIPRRVPRA